MDKFFNKIPEDKFVSDLWSVYQYIIDDHLSTPKVITVFGEDHASKIKDLVKICKMYKPDDIVLEREDVMPSYNMNTLYKYKQKLGLKKGIKDFRLTVLGNGVGYLYDNTEVTFYYFANNVDDFRNNYITPLYEYIDTLKNPFPENSDLWKYFNTYVKHNLNILTRDCSGDFSQKQIWCLQQVYSELMDLQIFTHLLTGSFKRSFVLVGHYHSLNLRNMLNKFLYISRVLVESGQPLTKSGKISLKDTLIPKRRKSKGSNRTHRRKRRS